MTKPKGVVRTVNITRLFRQVSTTELDEGLDWYTSAWNECNLLAEQHAVPASVAAGVIAATSPKNPWPRNVALAARILETGDTSSGYLGVGLRYSQRMLDGEDPLAVLQGMKTRNFYRSIVSGGVDGICIDRHAWDVAVGIRHTELGRPAISSGRYKAAAEAYRRAATILNGEGYLVSAAQVQAVTWVAWKNRHGIQEN